MNTLISRSSKLTKYLFLGHRAILLPVICRQKTRQINSSSIKLSIFSKEMSPLLYFGNRSSAQPCSYFSKKKKTSKVQDEIEESDEEDSAETQESDEIMDDYNLVFKTVSSLRLDSVFKAGLLTSKKKIEKDFYAAKIRLNGETVLKKSAMIHVDYELDLVKGTHPENIKMLIVDRIIVKSIGKLNDSGNYPLKMQVFKSLTIENYNDPWVKSSLTDND